MMMMMVLSSISGTSGIRDLKGKRVLSLPLMSEAHNMAGHGFWTLPATA